MSAADSPALGSASKKRPELALIFAVCGVLFSLLIFLFMLKQERETAIQQFQVDMSQRVSTLEHQLTLSLFSLESLQAFYLVSDQVEAADFSQVVNKVAQKNPALQAMLWLPDGDQANGERIIVPMNSAVLEKSFPEPLVNRFIERQKDPKSSTVVVAEWEGTPYVVAANPAYASGQVLALVDISALVDASGLLAAEDKNNLSISVIEQHQSEQNIVFTREAAGVAKDAIFAATVSLDKDSSLIVSVAATEEALSARKSYMPALFLLTGLLLSFLFSSYIKRLSLYLNNLKQEQDVLTQQLQDTAWCDPLTGVANRIHFDETLDIESRRAVREFTPMSLALLELDGFSEYLDMYGPEAGNVTLCKVSDTLNELVSRPGDMVARLDEQQFGFVLPSTNELVVQLAERCCEAVRELGIPNEGEGEDKYLTISMGVATMQPTSHLTSELLFKRASQGLEEAQKAGGDQCRAYTEETTETPVTFSV